MVEIKEYYEILHYLHRSNVDRHYPVDFNNEDTVKEVSGSIVYPTIYENYNGIDVVDFNISFNVGEPLKPLSKVASGGELSRIMLAFKSIYLKKNPLSFMVFDEIDSGISGVTARKIAKKMHEIAEYTQVLAITHLPQVASISDTHLYISKDEISGRTKTNVKVLSYDERITEIGIMLSGLELSPSILQTAKSMIDSFRE